MSKFSKPLSLGRLNDLTLGSFALVPPSETLNHLIRYLGTWSGSDKLFMVIQYALKLIIPFLELRARLQHRAGLRKDGVSQTAQGYAKFASLIGDSRTLWRIWGLLPIFQWLISLERNPPPTRKLQTIERLQGWSMLAYYPLEHIYYLCSHNIIPSSFPSPRSLFSRDAKRIQLNIGSMAIWSCRFWALYVVLQFAHLVEDRKMLQIKQRSLKKGKGNAASSTEMDDLAQRWDGFWNEVVVNIGYLPLTVHWSLERGLFKNEAWVGAFGLMAAVASFRSGWKATALRPVPSTTTSAVEEKENTPKDALDSSLSNVTALADGSYEVTS